MCGIVGFYNLDRRPIDRDLLMRMTKKLTHRGPDDFGVYINENVGLGHTRLSVIDLSSAGHQPMEDESDALVVTYNGEIYNFRSLQKELEGLGRVFKSKTDTEVLLQSYAQWGVDCLNKINGMFAFAIWDIKKQQLFLARDRMGEKPLYYHLDSNHFVFASEIKAILENRNISREIDCQGMANYFTFGNSIAPDTVYQGIKKIPAGHYLILKNNSIEIARYWDANFIEAKGDRGSVYYREGIKRLFERAVEERLMSDVPLGVFLSGGIDSSAVVAMMARTSSSIKTFSVGFDMAGNEFNELVDARTVANHFKTDHHEVILKELDLVNTLDKLVYHFDEPFGDAANFPVFLMSQFAKKYITVVLTGDGGDEIFGGYRRYFIEKNREKLSFLSYVFKNSVARKAIGSLPKLRRLKKFTQTISVSDDLARYTNWINFFSGDMLNQLLIKQGADPLKIYKKHFSNCTSPDIVDKIMYLDQKVLLPDRYLEKVDKASMAVGLEARAPLLDYKLVEFANTIPAKYKIRGLETKSIFREAMRDLLPKQILEKKKHGFSVPTNSWFRGKLKNYLFEVIFDAKTKARGYFDYGYIEKLYKLYQNGNQPLDSQFWLLLNFELWHRQFIDKK